MVKVTDSRIGDEIRRIELELINVETRLKNTGMLERSYSGLQARREIVHSPAPREQIQDLVRKSD